MTVCVSHDQELVATIHSAAMVRTHPVSRDAVTYEVWLCLIVPLQVPSSRSAGSPTPQSNART